MSWGSSDTWGHMGTQRRPSDLWAEVGNFSIPLPYSRTARCQPAPATPAAESAQGAGLYISARGSGDSSRRWGPELPAGPCGGSKQGEAPSPIWAAPCPHLPQAGGASLEAASKDPAFASAARRTEARAGSLDVPQAIPGVRVSRAWSGCRGLLAVGAEGGSSEPPKEVGGSVSRQGQSARRERGGAGRVRAGGPGSRARRPGGGGDGGGSSVSGSSSGCGSGSRCPLR